jgi:hypothetical protein
MSQKETTDAVGHLQGSESPSGNLSKLTELARQAYEQKRTKDCLDLTRAMLLIDPDNADAQWMRFSIQSEMHRDLENSRAFLQQVHSKENSEEQSHSSETVGQVDRQLHSEGENLEPLLPPGTVQSPAVSPHHRRMPRLLWLAGVSVLIVVGVVIASVPRFRTKSNAVGLPEPVVSAPDSPKPIVSENSGQVDDPLAPMPASEVDVAFAPASVPASITTPAPGRTPRPGTTLPDGPSVAATGTLAISSPTSVDIYKDDAYLGSVPISLELPAGAHMLEYRHGTLRKNVTHVINSNETTRAMITFDVSIPINSKPWAEVFLDGIEKKALGQTPLSGARVPIGSVLIFENPQFQTKKYRVTGNETGIQIVFP